MQNGIKRLSRTEWYALGGFRNPSLFRKQRGNGWAYFQDTTHPAADYDYSTEEST